MFPRKLSPGDEIRVVAPSTSFRISSSAITEVGLKNFAALKLRVTYGDNCEVSDEFGSSSISSRIADIHAAFTDLEVKGILTAIGGYNSNQLLRFLDYDLIKANPKIFCGFQDLKQ